ncbi:unnamed protein product [Camellia sinensis]
MTSSPKSFYARPSSDTRISTFLILYFLIGFTGFIFGFVAISEQSLGYKCRSGKSRLVSVVWDRSGGGIGNGAEVPNGDQKGTKLWVSLEFKLGLHQWYGGDPCGKLGCHLISKDFNESSLKVVGVAHNAIVGSVVIWLMIKDSTHIKKWLPIPGSVVKAVKRVYSGLQSRIRIVNLLSNGAECNSKLAVDLETLQSVLSPGNVSMLHEFLKSGDMD